PHGNDARHAGAPRGRPDPPGPGLGHTATRTSALAPGPRGRGRRRGLVDLRALAAVGDSPPGGLGGKLDQLVVAVRLRVAERLRVSVEEHFQLAFLDALVQPGAAKHEPAQPVNERALRGSIELSP